MPWYEQPMVLRDFAEALVQADYVEDATVVFSKPYRFTSEYTIWKNAQYPSSDADDGWTEFINGLNAESEEEEEEEEEGE